MNQTQPAVRLTDDGGAPLQTLIYSNDNQEQFAWTPARLRLSVDAGEWRGRWPTADALFVELPPGWQSDQEAWRPLTGDTRVEWSVTPTGPPASFSIPVAVLALTAAEEIGRVETSLKVELRGHSQFDPAWHGFPFANRASVLGHIGPDPGVFRATYRAALAPRALFEGLYRSIVFIGGDREGYRGGLCSGMARAALQRSLDGQRSEPGLEEILRWHGRQLTDRALLASAAWFLAPSPRRAYTRFRDLVIRTGRSDLCFDIAVPRPLRRDLLQAIQKEGHTVVPYAFRQAEADRAEVLVYDPNHPESEAAEQSVITFDLAVNRYAYRRLARLDDASTTIIAVRQQAYARGQTAILASLASLILYPTTRPAIPIRLRRLIGLWLVVMLAVAFVRARQPKAAANAPAATASI